MIIEALEQLELGDEKQEKNLLLEDLKKIEIDVDLRFLLLPCTFLLERRFHILLYTELIFSAMKYAMEILITSSSNIDTLYGV
jgi:hypothetical protein